MLKLKKNSNYHNHIQRRQLSSNNFYRKHSRPT